MCEHVLVCVKVCVSIILSIVIGVFLPIMSRELSGQGFKAIAYVKLIFKGKILTPGPWKVEKQE